MQLLLFAPGAHAPWTEGRKNLVRDLHAELRAEGHAVALLAGSSSLAPILSLARCTLGLAVSLLFDRPARVFQFPFGTFHGLRGRINLVAGRVVQWMCRAARVPLLTVLYSADGIELADVPRLFGRAAACTPLRVRGLLPLRLGTRAPEAKHVPSMRTERRLLFLCGYQSPAPDVVRSVLDMRGLGRLLDACTSLDRASLTIAIPFLKDPAGRDMVARELAQRGIPIAVRLDGESDPIDLLESHDVFVFPYAAEHALFVPTSMLEAMMVGIPVVATDRAMYRNLTRGDGIGRCTLAADDSATALARAIQECVTAYDGSLSLAATSREWTRREWSIRETARQLMEISLPLG